MQPDTQPRMLLREIPCPFRLGLGHHQAGLSERPGGVVIKDGVIDCAAATEVVAGDDQLFQIRSHPGIVPRP